MTVFWNTWVIVLIFIFLAFMALVVIKYWRTEHTADKDKTIESFDGIDENDAPPPRIFYLSYLIAFIISAGFLVLYPGLGNWSGLMGWKQIGKSISLTLQIMNGFMAEPKKILSTLLNMAVTAQCLAGKISCRKIKFLKCLTTLDPYSVET